MTEKSNNVMDQLDALINKQATVLENEEGTQSDVLSGNESNLDTIETMIPDDVTFESPDENDSFEDPLDNLEQDIRFDIDYGNDDIQKRMEEEDERERVRLDQMRKEHELKMKEDENRAKVPATSLDPEYQLTAIKFQADKFTDLTKMVEAVKEKHGIKTEEIHIPESRQNMLAGELLDIYHNLNDGDVIPTEFEDLILKYWVKNSNTDNTTPSTKEKTTTEFIPEDMDVERHVININVPTGNPVVVNVDKDLIADINKTREVVVNVHEVDVQDMDVFKVIENSNNDTILEPYEFNTGNTPITLLNSAYRATMKAVNWSKIMSLSAPSGDNPSDMELKQWSVIFDQCTNVSIGNFKDTKEVGLDKEETTASAFENFLKATAYKDREVMMWAILVSTSKETEEIEVTCSNRNCTTNNARTVFAYEYSPRNICHVDIPETDARLKTLYEKTNNVAVGDEALQHWNSVRNTRRVYKIPDSEWCVEIVEPNAYTYINHVLPLLQKLYERYKPGEKFNEDLNLEDVPQFGYLTPHAIYVKSFSKIKDQVEYRYTKWDAIENILTNKLTMHESNIVLKLIEKFTTKSNPISFYLTDVTCPKCGDKRSKLIINNIGETLLFQLSQRLLNMPIEIVEMP